MPTNALESPQCSCMNCKIELASTAMPIEDLSPPSLANFALKLIADGAREIRDRAQNRIKTSS